MLVFWAYRFFYDPIWIEEHSFLENLIYKNVNQKTISFFSTIIASIVILFFSIYLIYINTQIIIFPKAYQVIGVFFVVFSGIWINSQKAIPDLFASIFLYLSLFQIFKTYKKENVVNNFFNIGFLYGISIIINAKYIFFLPLIVFSAFYIKKLSFKEFVSLLLGIFTIILTIIIIFFFFSKINIFFEYNKDSIISLILENIHKEEYILFIFPLILIILFVLFYTLLIKISSLFTKKVNFIFILFFIIEIIFVCLPGNSIESIIVLFVPLSFLSSNIFVSLGNKYKAIFYYSIILLTVFSQMLQVELIFNK